MEEENKQWYDNLGLGADSIEVIQSKGWQDANSIIKSYRELEKFSGQDKNDFIRVPKNDDGTFDYGEVYTRLGRPEKAEEYELSDSDFSKAAREVLFKNNITKEQAKSLQEFIDGYAQKTAEEAEAAREAELAQKNETAIAELKKQWGASFEKNSEMAKTVVAELGLTNEQLDAIGDIMGADKVANMFLRMAKTTDADNKPLSGYNQGTNTRESATARIAELRSDAEFMKKLANGDAAAVSEMMKLAASTVDPETIID